MFQRARLHRNTSYHSCRASSCVDKIARCARPIQCESSGASTTESGINFSEAGLQNCAKSWIAIGEISDGLSDHFHVEISAVGALEGSGTAQKCRVGEGHNSLRALIGKSCAADFSVRFAPDRRDVI